MKKESGSPLGVIAALAGVAVAGYVTAKMLKDEMPSQEDETFKDLIHNQAVFDKVDGAMLMNWFKEQRCELQGNVVFIVAKAGPTAYEMFALPNPPEEFIPDHYLLQAVIDADKNLPARLRLVSYGQMINGLEEKFGSDGYLIIKEE